MRAPRQPRKPRRLGAAQDARPEQVTPDPPVDHPSQSLADRARSATVHGPLPVSERSLNSMVDRDRLEAASRELRAEAARMREDAANVQRESAELIESRVEEDYRNAGVIVDDGEAVASEALPAPSPIDRPRKRRRWGSGAFTAVRNRLRGTELDAPIDISERRAERRREELKITGKRVALLIGTVIGLAGLVWILFGSPLLRYQYEAADVKIPADSTINRDEVAAVMTGYDGAPMLTLNEGRLERELESKIPEIADATVELDYPRSMTVTVTVHEPVACMMQDKGCVAVAADGTQLRSTADKRAALPQISVSGKDAEERAESIRTGLAVLAALDEKTRAQVKAAEVSDAGLVTLALDGGRELYWGAAERNDFKAKVVATLLKQNAQYYDVSVPDAPVTR